MPLEYAVGFCQFQPNTPLLVSNFEEHFHAFSEVTLQENPKSPFKFQRAVLFPRGCLPHFAYV